MKLTQPDIPDVLTPGQIGDFTSHAELNESEFTELNLSGLALSNVGLRESRLEKCLFTGTKLGQLFAQDVVFRDCDFTAAKVSEATLAQVHFTKCRMDGVDLSGSDLRDIVFEDCKLDLANFRQTKFKRVRFINCSLKETDYGNAELTDAEFTGSIIDQTTFDKVTAKQVDLSGAQLIGLIGWESLKGVTIDSLQLIGSAMQIVTSLGLKVRELHEREGLDLPQSIGGPKHALSRY
jgi:uncharacterized protein YjbI with pentapeptide repeats